MIYSHPHTVCNNPMPRVHHQEDKVVCLNCCCRSSVCCSDRLHCRGTSSLDRIHYSPGTTHDTFLLCTLLLHIRNTLLCNFHHKLDTLIYIDPHTLCNNPMPWGNHQEDKVDSQNCCCRSSVCC